MFSQYGESETGVFLLQVKALFLSACVYGTHAGILSGAHSYSDPHDSYSNSALSAPSASYGPPSHSYGPPDGGLSGPSGGGYPSGGANEGSLLSDPSASGAHYGGDPSDPSDPSVGSLIGSPAVNVGPPRVIGQTVTVGRPQTSATRYELEAVVQNIIRRVPVEVTRHVQVAVPQAVPVPVRQEVKVAVPQPYPVPVEVVKHVPYPVYKTQHHEVERPVPYEVVKHVPFEVIRKVHVPVDKPYEVIKKIYVPIEKHVEVPHVVWKPHPLHIIKHVTHYKSQCGHCW